MRRKLLYLFILIIAVSLFAQSCDESVSAEHSEHVHVFGAWSVKNEASCTEEGLMERVCEECGRTEEHTVEKLNHKLEISQKIEPDCEKQGYTEYVCECGYTYKGEWTKPLGHELESERFEVSCTEQGYTHYACKRCEYEFNADFVKPLAHVNSKVDKHYATVNASGYTLYTCEDCGHSYMSDFVSYSDIVSGAAVENTEILKRGIDTSKYNHKTGATSNDLLPIDWAALKAKGVDFVILKAGSSLGKDPAFEADYLAAKAAGLEVGAYFYAYSTTVGGTVKDAEMLLEWIEGKQFEYPVYFDIEDDTLLGLSKEHLTDMCTAFCETLQRQGYYAALYVNNEWLYKILDTDRIKASFDVWYARYPLDTTAEDEFAFGDVFEWNVEVFGEQMGMWQYTESGTIEGFYGKFDFSYAYKDYPTLIKKWELNGF